MEINLGNVALVDNCNAGTLHQTIIGGVSDTDEGLLFVTYGYKPYTGTERRLVPEYNHHFYVETRSMQLVLVPQVCVQSWLLLVTESREHVCIGQAASASPGGGSVGTTLLQSFLAGRESNISTPNVPRHA